MIDLPQAVVIATLNTKKVETEYLLNALRRLGLACQVLDISLETGGKFLPGEGKVEAMRDSARRALLAVEKSSSEGARVFIGIGGGTGAQIAASAMSNLPLETPKILVTTLASDLRKFAALNGIILVPTVADLIGTGPAIRNSLSNAAAMAAALVDDDEREIIGDHATIGITALGVVAPVVDSIVARLATAGHESTTFHANGYGGGGIRQMGARRLVFRDGGLRDSRNHRIAIRDWLRLAGGQADWPHSYA